MDWNANASLLWDWDSHMPFGGNYKLSPAAAIVLGGGGASSGSELGNGSSSKSTISASSDSSSKAGREQELDANPRTQDKNRFLQESGSSTSKPPAAGLEESQIGLKLGKRTYFEDVSAESNTKNTLSDMDAASAAPALVKKPRVSHQSAQSTCCQVEGCNADLSGAKVYHRKHRVCECHSKCPKVIVAGQERRFCQQCSRFHELSEFDQKKRSCRRRLSDHNARRRKPRPSLISFNSTAFSSSFYDDKHQMNMLWNKTPFCQMRSTVGSAGEVMQNFKLTQTRGPWMKSTKEGCIEGQLHLPNTQLSNGFFSLYHDVDKLLPLKGTAAEVLNQGSEASAGASNLDGALDLRRALSLLSTSSWGSSTDPGQTSSSILQLAAHPVMPMASSSSHHHWIYGQPAAAAPHQAQLPPYMGRNAIQQHQEFHLQNSPFREILFDPNQIH